MDTLNSTNIAEQAEQLFNEFTAVGEGTMRALAHKYGLKTSQVLLRLQLHGMPPEIFQAAKDGVLTERQVKRICSALTPATRERYFLEALNESS